MAEEAVLGFLEKNDEITDSGQFAAECGIDHQEITNIIKSLYGFKLVDAQVPIYLSYDRVSVCVFVQLYVFYNAV